MNHTPSNSDRSATGPVTARRMVPLTVWLCSDTATGDTAGAVNRTFGQARPNDTKDNCPRHRQPAGRELARHLIGTCTREGDVVVEGFTTSEATLVAAAGLDRRGIALVPHFPLAQHIGARLRATLSEEQLTRVAMRPVRPDQMARGLADHLGRRRPGDCRAAAV